MARIRSVKPEFWDDRKLAKRTSRDARLLYIALWNLADEHARLIGDPAWIKGKVFAYEDDLDVLTIDKLLDELAAPEVGAVVQYETEGDPYIYLPKLARHQRLEGDKVPSRLPAPPGLDATRPEPGTDEPARGADKPARGADEPALSYGAGSRGQVAGSRNARGARGAATMLGNQLLDEHLAQLDSRPPRDFIAKLGDQIESLLADSTPDEVSEAMRRWRAGRLRYGPGILPGLIAEIRGHGSPQHDPPSRSTTDDRVAQAQRLKTRFRSPPSSQPALPAPAYPAGDPA